MRSYKGEVRMRPPPKSKLVVIVSANVEWQAIRSIFADADIHASPLGEWFVIDHQIGGTIQSVVLFHGGWGKIAAAASAQYVVDCCRPSLIVNLGTCGGFEGEIERGTVILVDRVIVYDILEQMGDHDEHIAHYTTTIDLAWLKEPYPQDVLRTLLVSGDRDLVAEEIPILKATLTPNKIEACRMLPPQSATILKTRGFQVVDPDAHGTALKWGVR